MWGKVLELITNIKFQFNRVEVSITISNSTGLMDDDVVRFKTPFFDH